MATKRLSTKQRVFVEEYLICWNATEAARRAGYKHPNVQGPRLLVNVSIQAAIQARVDEIAMSANETLLRLTEQARGDIRDFIVIDKEGKARIDLKKARAAGKLRLVKRISETKYGLRLELYDAQGALQLIGRHRGMFIDKTALTDPTGELPWNPFAGMTNDEVDDEIRRMEQRGERTLPPAEAGAEAEGSAGETGEDPGGEEVDA